jgi:hypothetical protein
MTSEMYLAGLLAKWGDRDSKYIRRSERGKPLSREEVAAILLFRKGEAMRLDQPERGLALQALREWRV